MGLLIVQVCKAQQHPLPCNCKEVVELDVVHQKPV